MLFIKTGEPVVIINRAGRDTTHRYPDVVAGVEAQFLSGRPVDLVLDGELLVFENGRPSFPLTAKRDAQSKPAKIASYAQAYPAVFMAFDCVWADGSDLRSSPLEARLVKLEASINQRGVVSQSLSTTNIKALWEMVKNQGLEGIIVKRLGSRYEHKRSKSWVKCKPLHTVSCKVLGVEAGEGARAATFGALQVGLYDDNGWHQVAKVGTGFKQADLEEILFRIDAKQELIVEVAFQEIGSGGQLRFPSFKGIRSDIDWVDCVMSQLPERVQ
jgi:ATP-dependent DNA ligase